MVPRNPCVSQLRLGRQLISTKSLFWISRGAHRFTHCHNQRLTLGMHASWGYMSIIVHMLHQCMASYITFLQPDSSRPSSVAIVPIFRLHISLENRDRPVTITRQECRWQLTELNFSMPYSLAFQQPLTSCCCRVIQGQHARASYQWAGDPASQHLREHRGPPSHGGRHGFQSAAPAQSLGLAHTSANTSDLAEPKWAHLTVFSPQNTFSLCQAAPNVSFCNHGEQVSQAFSVCLAAKSCVATFANSDV